jgi:hypothetical protein
MVIPVAASQVVSVSVLEIIGNNFTQVIELFPDMGAHNHIVAK